MSSVVGATSLLSGGQKTYATWSPTNKSSYITLSNGNLTLLGTTGQYGSVISNIGVSPGSTGYCEFTVNAVTTTGAQFLGMGDFIPSGGASVQQVGAVTNSFAFRGNASTVSTCIRKVFTGSSDPWVGLNPCTIALGNPCIVTVPNHNYYTGMQFVFTTTGALPVGLATGTNYWVHVINADTFYVAASLADSVAGPYKSGLVSQSGVHKINPTGLCSADLVVGDVISCSINLVSGLARMYLNGVKIFIDFYVPTPGSTWYACASSDGNSARATANFGQNPWDPRTASIRASLASAGYRIGIYS